MKSSYKIVFVFVLSLVSLAATAQKDTTYNRQVMLEREYTPTLREASKINSLPAVYEPVIQRVEVALIETSPQMSLDSKLAVGFAPSGDIKTDIAYSKKRGYLILGAGTYANLDAALGYRVLNSNTDQLDIFGSYLSTDGNINYAERGYARNKAKAKYAGANINLNYEHTFAPSILSFKAAFHNVGYNYYGNSFLLPSTVIPDFDFSKKQNIDIINFAAGIKSRIENAGMLHYHVNAGYRNFQTKYGTEIADKGPKGGQFDLNADLAAPFEADKLVGVKVLFMNQTFGNASDFEKNAFKGFTNITGTPYFNIEGATWAAHIGLNVSALFDVENSLVLTPDFSASMDVATNSKLYGQLTGGVNNNTFLDILQQNRYVSLLSRVEYSKTILDAKIGFKSGIVQGLEFDIFGGYKQTNKDHLYIPTHSNTWANMSMPIYANISTGQFGGQLKTNLIPYVDISAKLVTYFYTVKYKDSYVEVPVTLPTEKKAWGLPSFTAELNADVKPVDELTFSIGYLYGGGRKMWINDSSKNMNNINELNIRGEYQIKDWVSVYARLNNILSQKYELVPGYTLQGFNFLGGISLKF